MIGLIPFNRYHLGRTHRHLEDEGAFFLLGNGRLQIFGAMVALNYQYSEKLGKFTLGGTLYELISRSVWGGVCESLLRRLLMTFHWKYAGLTNLPTLIIFVVAQLLELFRVDRLWVMFVVLIVFGLCYYFVTLKVMAVHPELSSHHYERGRLSNGILIIATIGWIFLVVKLDFLTNIAGFLLIIFLINFLADGFANWRNA